MHIRIPPNEIAVFSSRLKAVSVELDNTRRILYRAVAQLDWEVSRKPEIDGQINKALMTATRLSDESFRFSFYLKKVEGRFQEADNNLAFSLKESFTSMLSQSEGTYASDRSAISASIASSQVGLQRKMDILSSEHYNQTQSLSWIKGLIEAQ